ncbi:MAG: hypothetical protein WCA20_16070, partial [Candidatus Sulfotelmatobacter sp.]
LEHEHHIIERVVAAMVVLAEKLQSGKEVEAEVRNDLVEFLQVFAEDRHHAKEENTTYSRCRPSRYPLRQSDQFTAHSMGNRFQPTVRAKLLVGGV